MEAEERMEHQRNKHNRQTRAHTHRGAEGKPYSLLDLLLSFSFSHAQYHGSRWNCWLACERSESDTGW